MNDPYLYAQPAIDRLTREWRTHGKLIIAVDFDDTIFDYHRQGHTYDAVIQLIRDCAEEGAYICVFTGSPPDKYDIIRTRFAELEIPLSSINENPFPLPFGNHGKMYYNILLDDRAGLGQAFKILSRALEIRKQTK